MNDERKQTKQGETFMESLVQELARLQVNRETNEVRANEASAQTDASIDGVQGELFDLAIIRNAQQEPYKIAMRALDVEIEAVKDKILAAWDGDKRTVRFGDKLLKVRTLTGVDIKDGGKLLTALMDTFTAKRTAAEFIATFNKKSIRAFLELHPQEPDIATLTKNTKVYLDLEAK